MLYSRKRFGQNIRNLLCGLPCLFSLCTFFFHPSPTFLCRARQDSRRGWASGHHMAGKGGPQKGDGKRDRVCTTGPRGGREVFCPFTSWASHFPLDVLDLVLLYRKILSPPSFLPPLVRKWMHVPHLYEYIA